MPLCAMSLKSHEIHSHLFLCPPTWSPSTHICNFVCHDSEVLPLSSFQSLSLSSCCLVPVPLPRWGFLALILLLAVVLHTRPASLTSDKVHQLPLCFLHFPLSSRCLPWQFITASPSAWGSQELISWRAKCCFCMLASFCSSTAPHPASKARLLTFYTLVGKIFILGWELTISQ